MLEFFSRNAGGIAALIGLVFAGLSSSIYVRLVLPLSRRIDQNHADSEKEHALMKIRIEANAEAQRDAAESFAKALLGFNTALAELAKTDVTLAIEQGRQAERIHYLSNEISRVDLASQGFGPNRRKTDR